MAVIKSNSLISDKINVKKRITTFLISGFPADPVDCFLSRCNHVTNSEIESRPAGILQESRNPWESQKIVTLYFKPIMGPTFTTHEALIWAPHVIAGWVLVLRNH